MPSGQRKLRVPDEVVELVRHFHPELKAKIKAALKNILENPACGKALKDELHGLRSYRAVPPGWDKMVLRALSALAVPKKPEPRRHKER